jgi:hypothetical protein
MRSYSDVVGDWHVSASSRQLLAGYARTIAELRSRGIVRSNNAPAGDYAEWLVARALVGELVENFSVKSYDVRLEDGRRVQVKSRVVSEPPASGQTQTSAFRSWDFELAALVLLRDVDYMPSLGVLVPVDIVRNHARHRAHVNGHVLFIRPPLTAAAGVRDITAALVKAAS